MARRRAASLPLELVRSKLARIWFVGSGAVFLLLIVQSVLGKYGTDISKVFEWFVPTVVPTLGLMIGVLGAAALGEKDQKSVKRSFYELALYVSVGYLIVLGLTILLEPFSPNRASARRRRTGPGPRHARCRGQ